VALLGKPVIKASDLEVAQVNNVEIIWW